MRKAAVAGGALVALLLLLALAVGQRTLEQDSTAASTPVITQPRQSAITPSTEAAAADEAAAEEKEERPGFIYGRVTTDRGAIYEGRLRWGNDQEAFWGDYFNGSKNENPWSALVPPERLPRERHPLKILGVVFAKRERQADLGRLFMARFGDIARIEVRGQDVLVTLKSGTVFDLALYEASDFDDGVRVWDDRSGVVDLDPWQVRTIELLPTAPLSAAPPRLHGTVRTRLGDFTGFVQWDREECVGSDELDGNTAEGELSLRFDTIRSIARQASDGSLVTLLDGREIVLSGTNDVGPGNRGLYVDDPRYGRVPVSWDAFERVTFGAGGSGPAYDDFPPGQPLTGSVTTRDGDRLTGRLVYDLDESETTETLDAPFQGVDFTIPFGLVASIAVPGDEDRGAQHYGVTLNNGVELQLEPAGDLGERNAGMLIYVDGGEHPEYLPWTEVEQVAFDRPPAMYPALGER